jgi:hypothetical protein
MKIDPKLLDRLAELEVEALLEGLQDDDMRKNPAFLEKVRKFLKENKLQTTGETPGVHKVKREMEEIPDFDAIN